MHDLDTDAAQFGTGASWYEWGLVSFVFVGLAVAAALLGWIA